MYKLFLLFLFGLFGSNVSASCCSFDLAYTPGALNIPDEESLLSCIEKEGCDSLFLFTRRMIHASKEEDIKSISKNFERALSIIKNKNKGDTTSLKTIYLYATFMERAGESAISSAYYEYIKLNSQKASALNILAHIGIAGIKNNIENLDQIKYLVVESIEQNNLTTNEILSILIRLSNYLDTNRGYSFSLENPSIASVHSRNDLDPELYYIYLSRLIIYLIAAEDKNINDYFSKSQNIYSALSKEKHYEFNLSIQSVVSAANHQYDRSLKESEELLKFSLDTSETIESILNTPPIFTSHKYNRIYQYALNNLYQTRVRPGLDPVKKSFWLYNTFYSKKIENSLTSFSSITADRHSFSQSLNEINILVVGCYLYNKTNDVTYLSKAISILDYSTGAGNYYWSSARNFAKANASFNEDILAQKTIRSTLLSVNSKTAISTIFQHQNRLEKQREKIKTNYSSFFDNISNNYQIDLNQISESCAKDSSGILALYNAGQAQYRLLVTPDTITITNMNHLVAQTKTLAKTLTSISNPKTNDNTKASQELYRLLFSDIDSLLPPNLHIIATGELENVPFNALRREAPGEPARYLGVEVALSRQMSIGSMRLMQEQEMTPRYNRPLGMAPAFNNEVLAVSELRQAGFVLPPLLYSTDEIKDLEERGPGNFFYGEKATLPNYLANVSDHSIIHLATHAISSQTDGLESRIYLTSEGGETSELYISDIGDQTLNADLVVLSACETGSGSQHTTEGRISLTKAYLAAGARSVVSSNWAVDDFATAALMKFFYQHIQEGKPPHQALQLSRKAYLEKYPDAPPYKWAAFDAYGGMKTVRWDRSRSKWPLVGYGALGLATLGLATAFYRRRRKAGQRA